MWNYDSIKLLFWWELSIWGHYFVFGVRNICISRPKQTRQQQSTSHLVPNKEMTTLWMSLFVSSQHNLMVQRRREGVKPEMPTAEERKEILAGLGGKPYWRVLPGDSFSSDLLTSGPLGLMDYTITSWLVRRGTCRDCRVEYLEYLTVFPDNMVVREGEAGGSSVAGL